MHKYIYYDIHHSLMPFMLIKLQLIDVNQQLNAL